MNRPMTQLRVWSTVLVALTTMLGGCDENAVQDITGPAEGARVRFFNFAVNAPGVNFYANATKLTAITSTSGSESTTGTTYGGAGSAGFYSAIAAGQYSLTGKIAAATDKDLTIAQASTNLESGKKYSFFMSGFYNTTAKSSEAFVVEDPFAEPADYNVASVRFVHAISNATPMTLYARNTVTAQEVAVGGSVAYKAAGAFTSLPPGSYDLFARFTGSTINTITRTAVPFAGGRIYTVSSRGDITVTSTTAATRPLLDNTPNR